MSYDDQYFMDIALTEARAGDAQGEQPFGAAVARNGELVVQARSLKVATCDSTAHSETLAIKYATQKLKQRVLPECTFYATCEPCPMCLGAIFNSGITRLVVGARYRDIKHVANLAFNFHEFSIESFMKLTDWKLELVEGIRQRECTELYTSAQIELSR